MSAAMPGRAGDRGPMSRSPAQRRGRLREALPVLVAAVIFVALWQLVVVAGDYPTFILPGPAVVAERFIRAWLDGTIMPHAVTTVSQVALGLLAGGVAGVATGIVLARSRVAAGILSPYIVAAQATPILALAPLVALWFGTGLGSRVLIVALICYFPIAVGTMVGIRSVDGRFMEMGRSLRATRWQLLRHVELPSALPQVLGGLRIGVTLAVVGAIVAEWAGGERGLGVLINLARGSMFDIPLMFATLFTIALLGILLYVAVVLVERRLLPYAP
ncbi:ABC transporter permease [soil metagenome]